MRLESRPLVVVKETGRGRGPLFKHDYSAARVSVSRVLKRPVTIRPDRFDGHWRLNSCETKKAKREQEKKSRTKR